MSAESKAASEAEHRRLVEEIHAPVMMEGPPKGRGPSVISIARDAAFRSSSGRFIVNVASASVKAT
jgi:hypothetical protein